MLLEKSNGSVALKTVWQVLKRLNREIVCASNSTLRYIPREIKTQTHTNTGQKCP
jgi:hypothetical protein